jgi:CRISPR/Cas system-associated exonuclease Cas4 (RecB family)
MTEFPEKSWSFSKDKLLSTCPRAYYFSKFLMWGGWDLNSPIRKRKAYLLSKLTTIEQFLGSLVHEYIANNISSLKTKDLYSAMHYIGNAFNNAVKSSYMLREEWELNPKNYIMFYSVYYNNRDLFKDNLGKIIKEKTKKIFMNYFKSKTLKDIENGVSIIEIDKEQNYTHFFVKDYKIYSIVDFMYEKNDTIYIVDWKTGKKSKDDDFQLKLYALYAHKNYNFDLNKIVLINEYLFDGEREERTFDNDDIIEVENYILDRIDVMEHYLVDKGKNIPKNEEYFTARLSRYNCKWCNFKEICPEYNENFINDINK